MNHNISILFSALLFSTLTWAQTSDGVVILEQTISAESSLRSFSFEVRNESEQGTSEYEIFLQNGDGFDL